MYSREKERKEKVENNGDQEPSSEVVRLYRWWAKPLDDGGAMLCCDSDTLSRRDGTRQGETKMIKKGREVV